MRRPTFQLVGSGVVSASLQVINRRECSWFAGIRGTVFFLPRRFIDLLLRTRHNSVGAYTKSRQYSTKDSRDELYNRLRGSRSQASPHCNCYTWMPTFTQMPVSPAVRSLVSLGPLGVPSILGCWLSCRSTSYTSVPQTTSLSPSCVS